MPNAMKISVNCVSILIYVETMKKSYFLLRNLTLSFFFLSLGFSAFSQNVKIDWNNVREGESVEYCKTHKIHEQMMKNPAFAQQYQLDQTSLSAVETQMNAQPNPTRQIYYIPIVFHVIHTGGSENISDAQIQDALNILNRDYSLQNADASTVQPEFNASTIGQPNHVSEPANIEVQFRLATKAPDGSCFKGITRTYSNTSNTGDGGQQLNAVKIGNDIYHGNWPGDKYLNVFVASNIGGAAGYTMTPNNWSGSGTSMGNGIYILDTYLGSIGTSTVFTSRALTHEVGHWLNLQHTWGPNNNPGNPNSCSTDDGVSDTPNTIGVTSCKLYENSCGPKANVENYMDYSYCSKMFTVGQKNRMIAALNSSVGGRNNIWKAANLTATGADGNPVLCKVAFNASQHTICVGSTVTFTDESFNNVTSRTWNFQGGIPATSSTSNPQVTYNTPGVYEVKLTASDGTTTLNDTKTAYITVIGNSVPLPYFEGFENYNSISDINDIEIFNSNNSSQTWAITSNAAKSGNKSMYIHNFLEQAGNTDEFISPSIDLSTASDATGGVTLSFKYASAKKSVSQPSEFLKIYASNDCGATYGIRRTLQGTSLSPTQSTSDWTPSSSNWKTIHITNITSNYFVSNFRFKLTFESNGGNNLFIDDINLYNGAPSETPILGINSIGGSNLTGISIYPNPATSTLNVAFKTSQKENSTIQIIDLVGKVIANYYIKANEGLNEAIIDTQNLNNGSYFVKISSGSSSRTLQFVKN